jgi:hypothetical protein
VGFLGDLLFGLVDLLFWATGGFDVRRKRAQAKSAEVGAADGESPGGAATLPSCGRSVIS